MSIPDFYNSTVVMYIVNRESGWRLYDNSVNWI